MAEEGGEGGIEGGGGGSASARFARGADAGESPASDGVEWPRFGARSSSIGCCGCGEGGGCLGSDGGSGAASGFVGATAGGASSRTVSRRNLSLASRSALPGNSQALAAARRNFLTKDLAGLPRGARSSSAWAGYLGTWDHVKPPMVVPRLAPR